MCLNCSSPSCARVVQGLLRLTEGPGAGVWFTNLVSNSDTQSFCLIIKVIMFILF